MNKIVILVVAAAMFAAGCISEEPSLGAGSSSSSTIVGTVVFRSDLDSYATTNALSFAEKVAFVRSQSTWDAGSNVLRFSKFNNNYWVLEPATNVNLITVGNEKALVDLYEDKYGSLDPQ